MVIPTTLAWASSFVSSWISLLPEEDLAEVADAVAERTGADGT